MSSLEKAEKSVLNQRKLAYLDGVRLRRAVLAAAQRVTETQSELNRINVFPVADRDTGTNMTLTLRGASEGLLALGDVDLAEMSALLADSALLSARGNSGVILAQFFQGMAAAFAGKRRIGLDEFALSMMQAARFAEKAVANPCEGTILTVMRAWASGVQRRIPASSGFADLLNGSLEDARASLSKTPTQLKVLARAKVVDAGAQGFINMIEGVVRLMEAGETGWTSAEVATPAAMSAAPDDDFTFRYCTECIVQSSALDLDGIRSMAESLGNSLVIAGSETKVRIHIHTNDPASLFVGAAAFGAISSQKHEDIWAQRDAARSQHNAAPIAVVTDSSCDLPPEYLLKHNIYMVPVRITFGNTEYLDRVTITSEEIYDLLEQSTEPPKTSQATPESFLQAYSRAAKDHREAISILVSGSTSGTLQSALIAAKRQQSLNIEVVDSKTTSAALGFLVETAVEAIKDGYTLPEIRNLVEKARDRVKVFFTVGSLDYLIRTGRVGSAYSFIAKLLNLVPILSFSSEGSIMSVARSRPGKASWTKLLDVAVKESAKLSQPRFYVCHSAAENGANYVAAELVRRLKIESPEILKISPTMGAMVGPGVCAIAMMGAPENPQDDH